MGEAGCSSRLCGGEAVALQDVVGQGVPEHDRADLSDAAHGHLPQAPIAPPGMNAFANGAGLVLRLAGFARHAGAPSHDAFSVTGPRQERIGAALGLRGRTIDLDALAMRPLDVLGAAKPAVDEMAFGKATVASSPVLRHRPHEATIRAGVLDLDPGND